MFFHLKQLLNSPWSQRGKPWGRPVLLLLSKREERPNGDSKNFVIVLREKRKAKRTLKNRRKNSPRTYAIQARIEIRHCGFSCHAEIYTFPRAEKLTLTRCSRDTFSGGFSHCNCHMSTWFRFAFNTFVRNSIDGTDTSCMTQFVEQAINRWSLNLINYILGQARTRFSIQRCCSWVTDGYKETSRENLYLCANGVSERFCGWARMMRNSLFFSAPLL